MEQILKFYLNDGDKDIETRRFKGEGKLAFKVALKKLQEQEFCFKANNEEATIFEQKTKVKGKWVMRVSAQSNSRFSWYFFWPINITKPDLKHMTL